MEISIVGWNVRGVKDVDRMVCVFEMMKMKDMSVVVLSETHLDNLNFVKSGINMAINVLM